MLDTLNAHHEAILAVAADLEALVKAEVPDTTGLDDARFKVAELSKARTVLLDTVIYPVLLQHVSEADAAALVRLRNDRLEILARTARHVRAWSTSRIAAEWLDYQRVFTPLLVRLRLRIGAEKAILTPLIGSASGSRLTPVVGIPHGLRAAKDLSRRFPLVRHG